VLSAARAAVANELAATKRAVAASRLILCIANPPWVGSRSLGRSVVFLRRDRLRGARRN
jgi:ATP-dependent Lon protease